MLSVGARFVRVSARVSSEGCAVAWEGVVVTIAAPVRPVAAVSVACWRDGRVLLVRRGGVPLAGLWSLPGGRIEAGEAARAAALRELTEETGCRAEIAGVVDVLDVILRDGGGGLTAHFVLTVFAGRWTAGEAVAADDAAEAAWVAEPEIAGLATTDRLAEMVRASRGLVP